MKYFNVRSFAVSDCADLLEINFTEMISQAKRGALLRINSIRNGFTMTKERGGSRSGKSK